ncbi:Adenine-specific DNA methylase [Microbulbifer donghaiensis]|uniref:site-specific DNA-methyltransferase (adenine-specific) n=1 Tax=Microbulbifer donghaiensis TaxID=494016 RepID=A0A1M4W5P8_9GAMM|nr:DNA adenine methylase [Microbulbifer donghaiensis]SHE76423.1 Adenine-specific DNA methylase [Microbulbifer donghaiensis]
MTMQESLPLDISVGSQKLPFRTVHYLGSKLRFLDFIKAVVDDVAPEGGGVCDLFAGSGSVSQYLSRDRKVVSVDIQEYSRVICSALLKPVNNDAALKCSRKISSSDLFDQYYAILRPMIDLEERIVNGDLSSNPEVVCDFLESSSLYSSINSEESVKHEEIKKALSEVAYRVKGLDKNCLLASIYFGGIYFSFRQALELDVILDSLKGVDARNRDTLMASALSTASDIVNTVGKQFAQPIRPRNKSGQPKKGILNQVRKDRNLKVLPIFEAWINKYTSSQAGDFSHQVLRMDFREALNHLDDDISVVYADPPYTRDHYSRFYHGLETIAKMDFPAVSTTNIGGATRLSRGLYREDRHQSDFCIRSKAPGAFRELFASVASRQKILLLSYSPYDKSKGAHPRVVELEFLLDLASEYFSTVELRSPGKFSHSKLNRSDLHLQSEDVAEVLIVCR